MVDEPEIVREPPAYVIFGIPFHDVTFDEAVAWSVRRMRSGSPGYMATANVDFIMQAWRDPELQRILLEADLVIADGAPIVWASGLFGPKLRERVTGSDITPMLAGACAKAGLSIFLLGGGPGVAEKAAEVLCKRHPDLQIAGTYSPPLATVLDMDHEDLLRRLREARPSLLLVAFGAPKQEKFINVNVHRWRVPLAIGIGGTLDFLAGAQIRAPVAVQRIGLEWFWRMLTNPKRLFRRYAVNIGFLASALTRLLTLRRLSGSGGGSPPLGKLPGAQVTTVAAACKDFSASGHVAVDLHGTGRLDSAQLGSLLALARRQRAAGNRLLLVGGASGLRTFLRVCRLDAYFDLCDDEGSARALLERWKAVAQAGEVRMHGSALRIALPAELTATTVQEWTSRVDDNWPWGVREVRLSAAALEHLDSAGIGWLLNLRKACERKNASLVCEGFRGRALQTLKVARMDRYFTGP